MSEKTTTTNLNRSTCGRCGVYRDLHPVRDCERPRLSFWWDRHSASRHLAARLWLLLTDRQRMTIVDRLWSRDRRRCWCDYVDAALIDNKRGDYRCGCDVPLPTGIGYPEPGRCYCPPTPEVSP